MELPKFKRQISREQIVVYDPLGEFLVFWKDICPKDVESLEEKINKAENEREIRSYLEEHPLMLIQHLGGGQGRWVIPQQKLGVQFVTDFVIAEKSSIGFEWVAVELESPTARLFTKKGDPSAALSHAIRQVSDWRAWLKRNQNYAARSRSENGLGLTDIDSDLPGLIIIGKESSLTPGTRELRRQLGGDLKIKIHTYDWLVRGLNASLRHVAVAHHALSLLFILQLPMPPDKLRHLGFHCLLQQLPRPVPQHLRQRISNRQRYPWIPVLNYAIFSHGVFLLSNKVDGSCKNSSRIRHLFQLVIHNFRL